MMRVRVGLVLSIVATLGIAGLGGILGTPADAADPTPAVSESTADHTKFEALKKPFKSAVEVTRACLECHTNAGKQIHPTTHWKWELFNDKTGQMLGMKNVVNNAYMSVASNLKFCTSCHIGSDWTDDNFDFTSDEQVDCLVCHDGTGTYGIKKIHARRAQCNACHDTFDPVKARNVVQRANYADLAPKVAPTGRATCGTCHFNSDGGDGVKHGDLDSSLIEAPRAVDVHMGKDGADFACTTCHETHQHKMPGSRYLPVSKDKRGMDVVGGSRATCESCHGLLPHPETANPKLNDHVDRVACQTCHIPALARGGLPTKTFWDWSTAGRKDDKGKEVITKDDKGRITYSTKRGDARWAENLVPEYVWSNGTVEHKTLGDTIDPSGVVRLNTPEGTSNDPDARIWPVKVLRGKQPYDSGNRTLVAAHFFGTDKDAYWTSFDWKKAVAAGMAAAGKPFSGEVGFVNTEFTIPINHMVAPKENAVACESCHSKQSRLAGVMGVYLPRRDADPLLDFVGIAMVLAALAGVLGHGALRIVLRIRAGRKS